MGFKRYGPAVPTGEREIPAPDAGRGRAALRVSGHRPRHALEVGG